MSIVRVNCEGRKTDGGMCLPALSDDVRQWNRYCEYCIGGVEYNGHFEALSDEGGGDAAIN